MKIVFIHQDLFFQGGQLVTARLASGLAARGHHVEMIVSKVHVDIQNANPTAKPFSIPPNVPLHVLPSRRAMKNVVALGLLLRKIRPDVVVTCVGHYNQCAVLAKTFFRLKAPIAYIEHNMARTRCVRNWRASFNRWCLNRTAKIVAVSDGVRNCIVESLAIPSEKVVRIYNPILDVPDGNKVQAEIHPWLLKNPRPFSVVAAGALTNACKGFDVLIGAFDKFHSKYKDSQLVIFGEGVDHLLLQKQICGLHLNDSVVLAGFTHCLADNFCNADCLAHASRNETFGMVLVEALAAGLPVVATDCPVGPREILSDGALGQLVPVDDADKLAAALERVYKKKFVPTEKFNPEPYRYDFVIGEYEDLLAEVVG